MLHAHKNLEEETIQIHAGRTSTTETGTWDDKANNKPFLVICWPQHCASPPRQVTCSCCALGRRSESAPPTVLNGLLSPTSTLNHNRSKHGECESHKHTRRTRRTHQANPMLETKWQKTEKNIFTRHLRHHTPLRNRPTLLD